MTTDERVSLSVDNGLATLLLTRALKRNAIDEAFLESFGAAVDRVAEDSRVKVMLLAGQGPSFCAGFDLDVLRQFDSEAERKRRFAPIIRARLRRMGHILERLWSMEPVTIAAVRGAAAGGGFSLMLACDLRIVATDARCWYPEVELGSPLSPASTRILNHLVPAGVAKDIVLAGRRLDADELLRLGIANRITDPDRLDDDAGAYADELLSKPTAALLTSKATINGIVDGNTVVRTDMIPERD